MKTLSKMNVEEAVYTELLREIKDGIWKNGDKLPSETELCRKMQVSRSSVRSAIQRLRALGVVEVIHGKGTYVLNTEEPCLNTHMQTTLNLTEKEFYDMTEFREAIEPNAIRLVVENGTQEGIGYIEKAYLAMRRAAEENDPEEYSRQDCLFHLSILMATGNEAIIQIANIFKDRYYNYFLELNKFLFEENDGNVKWFLENNPDYEIDKVFFGALDNMIYDKLGYVTILPNKSMDGFFMAKFRRK